MITSNTTKAVLTQDGRVLVEQPDGSYRLAEGRTDWARLDAMTDEEITAAASSDPDAQPLPDDEEWWKARLVAGKAQVTIRLDQDILNWFKAQGPGYQTRINAVLRQYKEAHAHKGRS